MSEGNELLPKSTNGTPNIQDMNKVSKITYCSLLAEQWTKLSAPQAWH